eukprot:TRINITY_DN27828_c0_g1_i1.p1 TRINITY_DN27828_c0_g1~~TRINITY_DN27828_c0_g1_i1.p1  ORF type:complete len:212 (+),score=18.18 TRINITY_DN27828_c0_g1_i1:111-746(+)
MEYAYLFKYIMVGDSCVGKSSLVLQFTDGRFKNQTEMTCGVEFGARVITIAGQKIKLQVWDTAGQERFRSITRAYYRGSIGVLLVYDVSRRSSFERLASWLEDVRQHTDTNSVIALVGNKCDLELREVSYEEGAEFASQNGLIFLETSAKTAQRVDEAFTQTAQRIYANVLNGTYELGAGFTGITRGTAQPVADAPRSLRTGERKGEGCQC